MFTWLNWLYRWGKICLKLIRALRYRTQSYTLFLRQMSCTCRWFVSFCTQLTAVGIRSKKTIFFFPICSSKLQSIMLRLDNASRERTIGMLQLGATQGDVARRFRFARNTIWRLWNRHRTTNSTADRPKSGRPRVANNRQDRLIRLRHLRNRTENPSNTATSIPGLRRISRRTVQRRLAEAGLRARRPCRGPMLTQPHCQRRLAWARRHLRWQLTDWRRILFTDESRFLLRRVDGRTRVYRRRGELFVDNCVLRHDRFGGWSVMMLGGIAPNRRTHLVTISDSLNAERYRKEILTPHVLPFIAANWAKTTANFMGFFKDQTNIVFNGVLYHVRWVWQMLHETSF